ncbi:hypothetical protein JXI42_08175 [bacterium]|nr:hypothetical protein [bacterium]
MVIWIWIVIILAAFQVVVNIFSLDVTFLYTSSILIMVAGVGMLYRVYTKQRGGKFEKQQKKLNQLESGKADEK